jgi:phosphoglycolate phosphatase
MIRVVVFDFDGTLVDSNEVKRACARSAVARFPGGAEALTEAFRTGGNRYKLFAEVVRRLNPHAENDLVRQQARLLTGAYTDCCARGIIRAPERRGAARTVAELHRRGMRLWINSATPARDLPALLRRRGITRWLRGALGGPASKASNLRTILAAERVAPGEVVMVGDGPDDFAAAREVRTWFIAINAENRITERVPFAVRDLSRLVPIIERLAPRRRLSAGRETP